MSDIAERMKSLLSYCPETGHFKWLQNGINKVKAGDIAGCNKNGYVVIRLDGVLYRAHRLAWLYMTGNWPEQEIDHINHIRSDNRWSNLRHVNHVTNNRNNRMSSNNKSGRTGVHMRKDTGRWMANIMVNGRTVSLGCYQSFDDAAAARASAESKYGFSENHGKA